MKDFLIYVEMRQFFPIYEEADSHCFFISVLEINPRILRAPILLCHKDNNPNLNNLLITTLH